jgi:hypothetical protein
MDMASFNRPGLTFHFGERQWLGPGSWPPLSLTLSGISRRARYSNGAESDSRGKKKEIKKK